MFPLHCPCRRITISTDSLLFCIIIGIGIIIELYILRIVYLFFARVRALSDADRSALTNNFLPAAGGRPFLQ